MVYASPAHPQTNGQVEAVNKIIKHFLKTRLEGRKGAWTEQLSEVLWAYRTTHKTSIGETPFALTFGTEAIVPVEIGMPSLELCTIVNRPTIRNWLSTLTYLKRRGTGLRFSGPHTSTAWQSFSTPTPLPEASPLAIWFFTRFYKTRGKPQTVSSGQTRRDLIGSPRSSEEEPTP